MGNYIQYLAITYNEKEYIHIHTHIYINHFAIHQKLTQHCKSTILQLKKKDNPIVYL